MLITGTPGIGKRLFLQVFLVHLVETAKDGDVVVTLGAGNVNRVCDGVLEGLS